MKKSELKQAIREEIISILQEESPSTVEPVTKPKPKTTPNEKPTRRRTLTPPKEAPKTRPKAYFTEAMIDKIIARYKKGKK